MKAKVIFIVLILIFIILISLLLVQNSKENKSYLPVFKGPYLGQKPPGREPQLFLPGLISTNYFDQCIGFLMGGRVCVFTILEKGAFYMYEKDGFWTKPQRVPWQSRRGATDFTAGPEDRTVYFQSNRLTGTDDKKQESNTWTVEWTGDNWTEPVPLPVPANTKEYWEGYPSAAQDGTVYFFTWARPDSQVGDIYRSRFIKGRGYQEIERLDDPVNSEYHEVDPIVAPDGSYLLFGSARPGGFSMLDLYISFRNDDGKWTHPVNTGPVLNPFCLPIRMSLTPDGKYFFFPSLQSTTVSKGEKVKSANVEQWGDADIYWISTDFVSDLRKQYMNKKCAAEEIGREYRNSGLSRAQTLLADLYSRKKNEYYFELSEFLIFCGEMIAKNYFQQADRFYETMLAVLPEEFRIKLGYSVACIMNGKVNYGLELMKIFWSQFPDRKSEDFWFITFQLRFKSRKDDELAVLKFVTEEFPGSPYAFYYLARAYSYYGDKRRAIEGYRKTLKLKSDFRDAAVLLEKLESEEAHE